MAEYIEREAAMDAITNDHPDLVFYSKREAIECIAAEPAADVVPVVRCKDCKHMEFTPVKNRYCRAWGRIQTMGDDGFCNFGERKDGDTDG